MGMSVGGGDEDGGVMSEINTTPLVDVMLVLLIIFLIAVPVVIQTAPVNLPKASNIPLTTKPENIIVGVDREGNLYWGAMRLSGGQQELFERLKERVVAAAQSGQTLPEVHLRADRDAQYQYIGGVIFTAQRVGIPKVGFISEPEGGGGRF
jgi:biopolymer transport protein ExbD